MGGLMYIIVGLLAVARYASACGVVVVPGTCDDDYFAVYSDFLGGNIKCIKPAKKEGIMKFENARYLCNSEGGYLAEPIGLLHESIYDLIMCEEYNHEAFWIGGTNVNGNDYWEWETSGYKMPTGTPHWYPCDDYRQPLPGGSGANHACIWEPTFRFYSCTDGIEILALCEKYPNVVGG